nr:MAG TPA: Head-to-tail joining protein W (GpW), fast protein folding, downhill [Caudoviricetes sp.]
MAKANLTPEEVEDLKARRKKLFNAYTSGTASISHNGKTVTFRSMSDIKDAINAIDEELGDKRTRVIKTVSNRGLA